MISDAVIEPLVSVLMPVRNEERYVTAAIRSVLDQDVPLELLVIDGRSTDRTVEVVRQLADPRVRVLDNHGRTIPAALNLGLRHARAGFVARIDAHARVSADYLPRGIAALQADPRVAGVGGLRHGIADTARGKAIGLVLSSRFGVGNSINHYADRAQDTDHASFGVYRASVAREVGGWDESLTVNEDVDFDHRIRAQGHRIRFEPAMGIFWQVRETLRDFGRQYRRYGRGKAGMVRRNGPSAVRARHLAAPALVGTLVAAGVAGVSGHPRVAAALSAPYAAAIAVATALCMRSESRDPGVRAGEVAAAFATMHVSWGVGFLEGLMGRKPVAASGRDPRPGGRAAGRIGVSRRSTCRPCVSTRSRRPSRAWIPR